jgi:pyruvate dehydrogenase E1 component alpha subunit
MIDVPALSGVPSLADGPPPDAPDLLANMLRIRFFEEEIKGFFAKGLIRGSTHLCIGQEATEVGVISALAKGDTMTCTYRGHGAVIGMGAPVDQAFAEILGRKGGLCDGRGGSMHFTDVSLGALGSNAIVGANIPITAGAALSAQYLGTGAVSVAFFGDGATNIGTFHEGLNLAGVWKLPAIFVIENNQYGEYSPLAATTPIAHLASRAASYGMPGVRVDGNDVVAVREVARAANGRARNGEGPTLIEAITYRHGGHSRTDAATYRPEGELEEWLQRDPILLLENAMRAAHGVDASALIDKLHQEVQTEVLAARDRALSWPEPPIEDRFQDVYA